MDIIDHIKQLDEEHDNKLRDLCINSNNYEAILEFYFGNKSEFGRFKFEISNVYNKQLKNLLYHKIIDFDQYIVELVNFINDLYSSNLEPDENGDYQLDNRLRISKSTGKNTFSYCSKSSGSNIRITFLVSRSKTVTNNSILNDRFNNIITLDNITLEKPKFDIYLYGNKTLSKITPYALLTTLTLTILFSFFTTNILEITQDIFNNSIYSKLAILILISCGLIVFSPIYKTIKSLSEYSRIALFSKINKKYSNAEKYINSFDNEKRQKVPLFENRERPISTPIEDFLGFNLLSASFFYNSVKNSFDSNINLITIIDAKRGMGKTSFINLLVQRINVFTYRHDGGCQLFKQILFNKQINIVQFSIMPFLTTLKNEDDEIKYFNNFITYIANNITPQSSKYLKAILSSITAINDKFNLERFISQIINNDEVAKLKNNLKLSEQNNLIIIEDLDRLNENQLKIFVKALWLIHELPFTITLLPCEESIIRKSVNLAINIKDTYEELEEHKLLQFAFPLKDYFYKMMSNYTVRLYEDTLKKMEINNELIQIRQLNKNNITNGDIKNDWVSHLNNNHLIKNSGYLSMRLHNSDFIKSIKYEIISLFEKYHISIREFKSIIGQLHIGTNRLFIVQQIIFYMIEYRYKYESGIIEYLNKYDVWGDFKKNQHLIIDQNRIMRNKLDCFTGIVKEMVNDLEGFPLLNINDGIISFTNALFGFINRSGRIGYTNFNKNNSANIFYCEFISVFLINNKGGQELYDNLSLNWHENFNNLSINCKNEFILAFNERAETTVSTKTQDHKFSYNLFLYQNFAILLLLIISGNKNNLLSILYNYFNGDKLHNYSIRIYNQFYDTTVSFEIDIMINYFRRLFNINHNNFEYDNTYQTLQNNYKELQGKLILEDTDPKFREVFTKIFKVNFTIKN